MNSLKLTNSDIYSVFEIVMDKMELKFLAGFEELAEAKEYVEYLATVNRTAWVYGHEEPPFDWLKEDAWVVDE